MSGADDNYNRGGLIAFLFSMVFSFVFFVWVSFVNPGIDLKEVPKEAGAQDTTLAGGGAGSAEAVDVSGVKDPWVTSEAMVTHGNKVYQTNCAVCHGPKGAGDGPAGTALVPPPRNLITGGWKVGGDEIALYETLQKGIEGGSMASFKHLPVVDRWALVHWIQSITEDKANVGAEKLAKFGASAD